jgi:hypothetical protein
MTTPLKEKIVKKLAKQSADRWVTYMTEAVAGIKHQPFDERIEPIVSKALDSYREQTLNEIDSFDLVEPCNPDCTPVEHAFHEGTWHAHLKLEKILDRLKGGEKK